MVERGAIVLYYNVVQRPTVVMGLLVSNALASLHGSRLHITSTLSKGTTVVIYLPADENNAWLYAFGSRRIMSMQSYVITTSSF